MNETRCPLCGEPLEVRDVAPCEECGGDPAELEHFREGQHQYTCYEVFPGLRLVLCNLCDVDFGSFDPTFFGLPPGSRIGYQNMRLVKPIHDPSIGRTSSVTHAATGLRFCGSSAARGKLSLTPLPRRERGRGEG